MYARGKHCPLKYSLIDPYATLPYKVSLSSSKWPNLINL